MNRKERRATEKRDKSLSRLASVRGRPVSLSVSDLMSEARLHYQRGSYAQAEATCRKILTHEPAHVDGHNMIGIIAQASGRHKLAVKMFVEAITSDKLNSACHYNLASSYQALDRREDAVVHFKKAIALGLGGKNIEDLIVQNPLVAACLDRLESQRSLPLQNDELFGVGGISAVTSDVLLRCAMECVLIRGHTLEIFLTRIRSALLQLATANALEPQPVDDALVGFFCALAQQCFINEYVFAQSDEEAQQANQLRDSLSEKIAAGSEISPLMLAAVAAYFPLYSLSGAEALLSQDWPATLADLVRQQVQEPLEELRDCSTIPVLTPIDDRVSLQVMQQYEENPYPRWTVSPNITVAAERKTPVTTVADVPEEILVTGCGTGRHVFQIVQKFPEARVLAIDISLPSLAYARRKSREAGLRNVEYAQADILKLGTLGRTFDRIEAVGVLHHLADPKAGWRILLSLLRPRGEMRIGLYSESARRAIVEARSLIAERGYRATVENIRKCRQEIFRGDADGRWKRLTTSADFYSMSGCRDLLFNVMEHRFTIPEIVQFLDEQGLLFLGFDLDPRVFEAFQRHNPSAAGLNDLNQWDAFEVTNPLAFRHMYVFSVCKNLQS